VFTSREPNMVSSVFPISSIDTPRSAALARSMRTRSSGLFSL